MEVLRHSIVTAGSLGRLPNTNDPGGGGGGDANTHSVGAGGSPHSKLNSPLSDPSNGSLTLRSPIETPGGSSSGGGGGFYSEPDELKSDDASSVASGFTSAESTLADPTNLVKNR